MSKLDAIAIANGVQGRLPEWMHILADQIGAPKVFYRFRDCHLDRSRDTLKVYNRSDYEWIRENHTRDLAKFLNVLTIENAEHERHGGKL